MQEIKCPLCEAMVPVEIPLSASIAIDHDGNKRIQVFGSTSVDHNCTVV